MGKTSELALIVLEVAEVQYKFLEKYAIQRCDATFPVMSLEQVSGYQEQDLRICSGCIRGKQQDAGIQMKLLKGSAMPFPTGLKKDLGHQEQDLRTCPGCIRDKQEELGVQKKSLEGYDIQQRPFLNSLKKALNHQEQEPRICSYYI